MVHLFDIYLPQDRRRALHRGVSLLNRTIGAALFADISGYTRLTETLAQVLGPWRGAEELVRQLNVVYDVLIATVEVYGGSVIGFSGDAITCWFDDAEGNATLRAVACAVTLQEAMLQFSAVALPDGTTTKVALKVAVASGPVRRFVIGDPGIQLIDVLAGETMVRMAMIEHLAGPGEVVIDEVSTAVLRDTISIAGWCADPHTGQRAALVSGLQSAIAATSHHSAIALLPEAVVRPWVQPAVYERLRSWPGEFLTELRPTVALFLKFDGIDYEDDTALAGFDAYIRWVQRVLASYSGTLIQLTVGDKGSYLYAAFGAPVAHEDDPRRAVAAALELHAAPPTIRCVQTVQIGISLGLMRVGTYGAATRRTYGAMGEDANLAARLMTAAAPGQILISDALRSAVADAFEWEMLPPISVKGKRKSVTAAMIVGPRAALPAQRLAPRERPPLIGRAAELTQIEERLAQAQQSSGQVVSIVADAGLGKSRLAAEIGSRAEVDGLACFSGAAHSYGVNTAYLAWRPIVQSLLDLDPAAPAPEQVAQLERGLAAVDQALISRLPLLGAVLDLPLADNDLTRSLNVRLRKESLEALLVDCLRARATRGPLLLVLEDTHWLDPLSRDLLERIAQAIATMPVLLLLTLRPSDARHLVPPAEGHSHITEIWLNELTAEESERLARIKLRALFGPGITPPSHVIRQITARAQGNPFYLEELLSYLHDRGVAPLDSSALWQVNLPTSLTSLVLSRVDQLPPTLQTTLKVASIIGRVFTVDWLWGVYPELGAAEQIYDHLDRLAQLGLTPVDSLEPELRYQFKHSIIQEAIYESLPFTLRAQLHEQIAGWLERRAADDPPLDLLAFHYGHSANRAKRREYYRRAGDAATAQFANTTAALYYRQLLDLLEDSERGEIQLALGQVLDRTGAWDEAERCYQAALATDQPDDAAGVRVRAMAALGTLARSRGRYDEALVLMEQAREAFQARGEVSGWIRVTNELGTMYRLRGDYTAAHAALETSLARATAQGDLHGMAQALHILGNVTGSVGELALSSEQYKQSLAIKRRIGDSYGAASSLSNLGITAYELGDYAQALALIEESLALFRQLGIRRESTVTLMMKARVVLAQGDALLSRTLFAECLAVFHELDARWELVIALIWLAEATRVAAESDEQVALAVRLNGAALGLLESFGGALETVDQIQAERTLAAARQRLGAEKGDALWQAGRATTWHDAIALAIDTATGMPTLSFQQVGGPSNAGRIHAAEGAHD